MLSARGKVRRPRLLLAVTSASLVVLFNLFSGRASPRGDSDTQLEPVHEISAVVDRAFLSLNLVPAVTTGTRVLNPDNEVEQSCIDAITSEARPGSFLQSACHIDNESRPSSLSNNDLLCSLLLKKTLMLAGGHQLYHLHLSLLRALTSKPFIPAKNPECPGREFCTWHEICNRNRMLYDVSELSTEHKTRVPLNATILRYSYSPSLFADRNDQHIRYQEPFVAPETGIRETTKFWRKHALSSEIVVLHRSPVPAPAWSYQGQGFKLRLESNHTSSLPLSPVGQAAWNATLDYWLPSVLDAIASVRPKRYGSRLPLVIWVADSFKPTEAKDPRTTFLLYQKVMQERFLRQLLPHYGIPLLSCAPTHTTTMDDLGESLCDEHMIDAISYVLHKTFPSANESEVE